MTFCNARSGAALLIACGLMLPMKAALAQAENDARAALEAWVTELDSQPDVAATFESISGTEARAIMTGLTILGPEVEIVFEPITVEGYRQLPPTGFAFGFFSVDRIQGRTPTVEINVIDLSVENLVVPESGFVFDPQSPVSSVLDIWGDMAAISVEELTIGRIDIGQFAGGLNSLVSYHNYRVSGWADGRIQSTSAGPLVMESPSPDELFVITVDEIASEDVDFNALTRLLDPAAYKTGDREWHTMLGHASYRNIIIAAPDLQMRIREIELNDFMIRQAAEPFTPILEQLLDGDAINSRRADALMQQILVDLISPWGLGEFRIQGLEVHADDVDRFEIGEFYVEDLSLDGLGEIGLSGVDIVIGGEGYLRLGNFAIGGLRMPGEEALQMVIDAASTGDEFEGLGNIIPDLGFIEIEGFEFATAGTLPVSLDRFIFSNAGFIGPIPTETLIEAKAFEFPLTIIDGDVRRILNQLGYTELISDFGLFGSWDEATETLLFSDLRFAIEDAGSIVATFELGGFTRELMENFDSIDDEDLFGIEINWAEISVTDESLADRLFQWTAEGTDTPPEQYRDEFIRGLPFLLAVSMDREVASAISPALQEFLRGPATLTISARPNEPVPLLALAEAASESPFALLAILGAELSVQPLE